MASPNRSVLSVMNNKSEGITTKLTFLSFDCMWLDLEEILKHIVKENDIFQTIRHWDNSINSIDKVIYHSLHEAKKCTKTGLFMGFVNAKHHQIYPLKI